MNITWTLSGHIHDARDTPTRYQDWGKTRESVEKALAAALKPGQRFEGWLSEASEITVQHSMVLDEIKTPYCAVVA